MLIWRILRGPGNTVREAPALLPELRASWTAAPPVIRALHSTSRCATGPDPDSATSRRPPSASGLTPLRPRYPGTSFILRYEANLPSGRSPGFAMWGKSRLRVSYPGLGWQ